MNISMRDLEIWAKTVYGEARGEGQEGMQAVAWVVKNRALARKQKILEVCLATKQFSCWNTDDPNFSVLASQRFNVNTTEFIQCVEACFETLCPGSVDITAGSDHYHADYIRKPKWALDKTPAVKIGRHLFYNNI